MSIISCIKHIGQTPLEVIDALRETNKWSKKDVKLSYAGRLDPMAHGLMIILKDNECYNQHKWHNMDKTYEFKLLIGISTDTYDILGKMTAFGESSQENLIKVIKKISTYPSRFFQEYPPYSSIRVNGKPLWQHARNGTLDDIDIPGKKVTIKNLGIKNIKVINKPHLILLTHTNIDKLNKKHNFRQREIKDEWKTIPKQNYIVVTIEATVSSGFYIRSFCNTIGEELGVPCMALDIMRTQLGNYYFL